MWHLISEKIALDVRLLLSQIKLATRILIAACVYLGGKCSETCKKGK